MTPADEPLRSASRRPTWGGTPGQAPEIAPSSVFQLRNLDHLEAVTSGVEPGYVYAREGHPNADRLAARLAEIEGAAAGLVFPSGMAAITALLFDRLAPGRRVVADRQLYGKTTSLVDWLHRWFAVDVVFADLSDSSEAERAVAGDTPLVFCESLSNPLLRWKPLDRIAEICRRAGALLAVDNTFTPPPVLRPLEMGADLVVHSLTKIISGHSDVTMGCLLGPADVLQSVRDSASVLGCHASAFDCWLVERSLETLDLRVRAACANAASLASFLSRHPRVRRVTYPGLADHPDRAWGARRAPLSGYMLCFEVDGRETVNRMLERLERVRFCPSLGDARTTVSHPASTSHRALPPEERDALGISEGLVRVSVGVDCVDDVARDFDRALRLE